MKKGKTDLDFTQPQLIREINRVEHRCRYRQVFGRTLMWLLTLAAAASLIAVFWVPVFRVTGNTLEPVLESGQVVVGFRTQNLKTGDLAAFYYENRILIRQVLAHGGDWIDQDDQGRMLVNGELQGTMVQKAVLEGTELTYPYQVPEGSCLVAVETSQVSDSAENGATALIAKEKIAARIIGSIWPLQRLEFFG